MADLFEPNDRSTETDEDGIIPPRDDASEFSIGGHNLRARTTRVRSQRPISVFSPERGAPGAALRHALNLDEDPPRHTHARPIEGTVLLTNNADSHDDESLEHLSHNAPTVRITNRPSLGDGPTNETQQGNGPNPPKPPMMSTPRLRLRTPTETTYNQL